MKNILCFGDSNTWGYHAKEDNRFDWHTRYPGVLSRLLGEEYHVIEDGLCGRTTQYESDIELYVNGKKAAELAAEVHAPLDYAVLMLGTNDCKDMYNASLEDIRKGIEGIAACFEQKGAKILLIAPVPMRGLEKSPFGIVGLDFAFPWMYTKLVKTGIIPFEKLIDCLSTNPRKRFGLPMGKSFSVWDLSAEVTVDENFIQSQGKATPILGEKLLGKNLLTVCDGRVVREEE